MAMFVGLDVSLKTTSICVVEADGSPVWEGKAESEPTPLVKAGSCGNDRNPKGGDASRLRSRAHARE
jgi:hypothetical protein